MVDRRVAAIVLATEKVPRVLAVLCRLSEAS
jgi:hypothetical protein